MPELAQLLERPVIIFDLFHTLSTLHHSGVPGADTHELLEVTREALNAVFFDDSEARLKGLVVDPTEIIADLARRVGSPVPADSYKSIADRRTARFAESLKRILPSVLSTLDCLRARPRRLALISNADVTEGAGWSASPLASRFETVIFSFDVGLAKPEPEIYELCMERLGVVAADCVFVGDGGSDEFTGARSAGIPSICTTEFSSDIFPERAVAQASNADCVIQSLSELCGL